jgi:hypothetical protein
MLVHIATDDSIHGKLVQYEEPTWEPLLNLLGHARVGDFMWMHEVALETGERVHAYKHIDTRRYIHLSETGRTYSYLAKERYAPIPAFEAAELALPPGPRDEPLSLPTNGLNPDLGNDESS